MPDKYGDVIIPMTIIRRFECALEANKQKVLDYYKKDPSAPYKKLRQLSGYQFYNTSEFSLKELCNDPDNIAANFKEYLNGFSSNVQDIFHELNMDDHIKKMDKDGCLYSVVKAFSELDLSIKGEKMAEKYDVQAIIKILSEKEEMDPDQYDGCYELMRETIKYNEITHKRNEREAEYLCRVLRAFQSIHIFIATDAEKDAAYIRQKFFDWRNQTGRITA